MLIAILHMEWKISKCWLCPFTGVGEDHRAEQNVLFFNCGPVGSNGRFSGSPSERRLEKVRTGASLWPSTVCSSARGTDFRGLSHPGVSCDTVSLAAYPTLRATLGVCPPQGGSLCPSFKVSTEVCAGFRLSPKVAPGRKEAQFHVATLNPSCLIRHWMEMWPSFVYLSWSEMSHPNHRSGS